MQTSVVSVHAVMVHCMETIHDYIAIPGNAKEIKQEIIINQCFLKSILLCSCMPLSQVHVVSGMLSALHFEC